MSDQKYTLDDGKTRAAGAGPWIVRADLNRFLEFCAAEGHGTRPHPDVFRDAHQIQYAGHWMSLIWNKSFSRYTADKRMAPLVQSFAAAKEQPVNAAPAELLPVDIEASARYDFVSMRFTPAMARSLSYLLLQQAIAAELEEPTREQEVSARFNDSLASDLMGSRRSRAGKFTVLVRKDQLE